MKFLFNKKIIILLVGLLLFGCGRHGSGDVMTIGMDEVTEMLKETGEAIDEALAAIEESQLSMSDRYQLTVKAAALLRQQNKAYAFLCDGELSQAITEAESLRVGAARLAERVELCCTHDRNNSSSGGKTTKDISSKNPAEENTGRMPKPQKNVLWSRPDPPVADRGWSWKITRKGVDPQWSKNEIQIQTGTKITITVYKNGVETPVVWSWTGSIKIQTPGVTNQKTELSSIEISRSSEGACLITFYPKSNPKDKHTIMLKPE